MVYTVCCSSGQWKWRCHLSDSPKNIVIYGIRVARDPSVLAVPLGQQCHNAGPREAPRGWQRLPLVLLFHYCNATAPGTAALNIKVLPKGQTGGNCSWYWEQPSSRSCYNKEHSWRGKGSRSLSTAECVLKRHRAEKQRKECHQGDKRFISSAQLAKPCTWLPQQSQWSMCRADVSSFQYLGNSTQAHKNCSKRQFVREQAALSVLFFELNKFHNGSYHGTVRPKNLSMSAKGSAVDWWQSVCPWNRPNSKQFDKESSKYFSYFCSRRKE